MRMKKEDKNKIYQLLELIYPDKSKEVLDNIINNIDNVYKQSVLSYAMPPGNISFLEENERSLINQLYMSVHNLKNK